MFETILHHPNLVVIDGMKTDTDISAGRYCTGDVLVETQIQNNVLAVYLTADTTKVRNVRLRWNFQTILHGRVLGDAWERTYADMEWMSINPFRSLPWYVFVQNGEETAGYGVMVRPGAICSWFLDPEGITLYLDVRNGGEGVALNGRRLAAARVISRIYSGTDPFTAAQDFCRNMCADPILPSEPVYGFNNWYYAYGHISSHIVLNETKYMAKLTEGLSNRPYVVIDDGWQRKRYTADGAFDEEYNGGPWIPNMHFRDMQKLAEQMTQQGVIPGIWVRLLLDNSDSIPVEWRLGNGALDPSIPEVLMMVRDIVDRIGQWGYRLLKHDFSTFDITGLWGWQMTDQMTGDGWHFADRSKTTAEIIIDFYRTILEAAKPHNMLVLGCNTIGHLGAGLMHMNRIGDDTSGLEWERTLKCGVNTLAFRISQHRAFYDVDADCIGITEHIDWVFNRQWGKLLSQSGTSLFVSVRPDSLPEDQEKELIQMLDINSRTREIAIPLDWQDTTLPQTWLIDGTTEQFHWMNACDSRPSTGT